MGELWKGYGLWYLDDAVMPRCTPQAVNLPNTSSRSSGGTPSTRDRESSRARRSERESGLESSVGARSSTRRPDPRSQSRNQGSLNLTRPEGGGDRCGKY